MLNYRSFHKLTGRSIGKNFILGSNFLLFILALIMVNREMAKVAKVVTVNPVSNKDIQPASPPSGDALVPGPSAEPNTRLASIGHSNDITESLRPWDTLIERYCKEFGVDPDLASAVLYIESRGDPYIVSRKGALGLMQITQATADFMGVGDVFDPEENIKAGVKYIGWLIKKYDETTALLAYNAGIGTLEQNRIPSETRNFIDKVLSLKTMLKVKKNKSI
jgi:soluble lytic murein transglycosylase-like protein